MKRRLLVTGGSGFIGRRLLEMLADQQTLTKDVLAFVRPSTNKSLLPEGIKTVEVRASSFLLTYGREN